MSWLNHPAYIPLRDQLVKRLREKALEFKSLRPVAFLCGKQDSPNRDHLRAHLQSQHSELFVFYAETVWEYLADRGYNALEMENHLARLSDIVIILVESPGTLAELGAFALSGELRRKLLPILDVKYRDALSFINSGPIDLIDRSSAFSPAIFADFAPVLDAGYEVDERIRRIKADRGQVHSIISIRRKPKHILFLLCDLVAIAGPLTSEHCEYYLAQILGSHGGWDTQSLLELARALDLLDVILVGSEERLYYRPLTDGKLQSFQKERRLELSDQRAAFLSVYQTIPEARSALDALRET